MSLVNNKEKVARRKEKKLSAKENRRARGGDREARRNSDSDAMAARRGVLSTSCDAGRIYEIFGSCCHETEFSKPLSTS